ncbi:MAG TPA: serine/threonine-protein kinase [Gemmatimonadales bacterium]|nr:serine/threonine-protein kinase [Gemmatimonadales bacterium]
MTGLADRLAHALGDRYRLEVRVDGAPALIGEGGMASVFLAEDTRHDRWVAVKVLKPELAATIGADRFLREIHIAAQLHHPHILGLIDSGEADELLYYVMPYVSGESLRGKIEREGFLTVVESVRLFREVADALARAHKAGVVHRDIKPENILIEERHALVSDFGVAKALSESLGQPGFTNSGLTLGTPSYMAPEQAAADPDIDHRVDIYALGIVAYEMLTGDLPFDAPTPQAMLAAHVAIEPAPVRSRRQEVPPALDAIVLRCLAKNPAERYQQADEIVAELEAMGSPSAPGFGKAAPVARGLHIPRGARRLLIILGVVIALLILGGVLLKGV